MRAVPASTTSPPALYPVFGFIAASGSRPPPSGRRRNEPVQAVVQASGSPARRYALDFKPPVQVVQAVQAFTHTTRYMHPRARPRDRYVFAWTAWTTWTGR